MSFDLTYALTGAGWAVCTVRMEAVQVPMPVSYLHDSLRELIASAAGLLQEADRARVVFMDEPGEHHLMLVRQGQQLHLSLRAYADWASWEMQSLGDFDEVLAASLPLLDYAQAVRQCAESLFAAHGLDGYRALWAEHPFPLEDLERLGQLLD